MVQVIKNFVTKVRELPHTDRLIIFIAIMTLTVILGVFLAVRSTMNTLPQLSKSLSGLGALPADISGDRKSLDHASDGPTNIPTTEIQDVSLTPADWQTHADLEYGFSIKYPKNFTESSKRSANQDVVLWKTFSAGKSSLDLEIVKTSQGAEAWIAENFKDGVFAVHKEDIKRIDVGGNPSFQFNVTTQSAVYHYTVVATTVNTLILLNGHELNTDPYPAHTYENFVSNFALNK